jgi:hypothetical protein
MRTLIVFFLLVSDFCYSQFKIIVDETYEPKIKTAIYLIYSTNSTNWTMLTSECSQIRITSDSIPNQNEEQIIKIPLKIISSYSYNELACWLVRQSYYLYQMNKIKLLKSELIDLEALKFESDFRYSLSQVGWSPENRKTIRKLKRQSKLYWDNNPYENHTDTIKDTLVLPNINKENITFKKIFKK